MEGESQMILSRSSKFRALEAALRNDEKKRVQYEEFEEVMKDVRPDIPYSAHPWQPSAACQDGNCVLAS